MEQNFTENPTFKLKFCLPYSKLNGFHTPLASLSNTLLAHSWPRTGKSMEIYFANSRLDLEPSLCQISIPDNHVGNKHLGQLFLSLKLIYAYFYACEGEGAYQVH